MNPLHSVGARLSLGLLAVLLGALGIVYVVVVPSLEQRLVDSKLAQLHRVGRSTEDRLQASPRLLLDLTLEDAAASAGVNARLLVLERYTRSSLRVVGDSHGGDPPEGVHRDPIVRAAADERGERDGTVARSGERYAEVALSLDDGRHVLLLVSPLGETLATVALVERRLVLAGALALLAAVAIGYGAASIFARRIRRLERAADRIAGGDFDEPVIDRGSDEVGQLADAFERMRVRLARLDHARREFIANASHELRTPIFSLSGFLELLADEELDDETRRDFLGTMRGQADRLTRLAGDLLDLSRLDAGRLRVEREAVDLQRVAGVLADEYRAMAHARGHVVETDAAPAVALADGQRVLQIGRALVENALLHTAPGTTVRVRAGQRGGQARLVVEDDGGGIPAEHAGQVFERFYRVDGGTASGSGLGLAIARELARAMAGDIVLESRPGRTAFTLALPAMEEVGTTADRDGRAVGSDVPRETVPRETAAK